MSTQEELIKAINTDKALMDELVQSWENGASAQEIASLLTSKGIDAPLDQVEALLADAQEARAARIETQDLDIDELNRMAGGGDGICDDTANCDRFFISLSYIPKSMRCTFQQYCDAYFVQKCYNDANHDGI